MSVSV